MIEAEVLRTAFFYTETRQGRQTVMGVKFPSPPAKVAGMGRFAIGAARAGRGLALAALLTLPMLAACQSTEPVGRVITPSKVQPSDPPFNPNPTHIVRLYGRAPESLDFRFRIGFMTTNREGDCYNHAGFWEGGGEKTWGYILYPMRNGEQWEADLVVDRYLPGRCGWNIRGSAVIMVEPLTAKEGDSLGAGISPVVWDGRNWDEDTPRCEPNNTRCSEERSKRLSNSDDAIPVQVRCRHRSPEEIIGDTSFICNEFPELKTRHHLKEHTRRIRIDLYDLDHEEVREAAVSNDDKDVRDE